MVTFGLKPILRLFKNHSCGVFGEKGSGKDMLMSNVAVYRREPYVANLDYGGTGFNLLSSDFSEMRLNGTTFKSMVEGNIQPYVYPYADGTDIYLSDSGCYFPCQYNDVLNRKYPEIPLFMALSRHLGDCGVHYNAQQLSRVWLLIREQCERYIWCRSCVVLFGKLVIQRVICYDKFETADMKVRPFCLNRPFFLDIKGRRLYDLEKAKFEQQFGSVVPHLLIYIKKSKYNTRHFKEVFERGQVKESC